MSRWLPACLPVSRCWLLRRRRPTPERTQAAAWEQMVRITGWCGSPGLHVGTHILSSSYSAGSHLSRWSVGAGAPESCLILWLPGSDQLGPGVVILPAEGWSLWRGLGCS